MQRNKGAAWEREVARVLAEATGLDIKRGLGQARSAREVPDVVGLPGWWIECKVGANPPTKRALDQAERDCAPTDRCVAIVKQDRREPMAYLRALDLYALEGYDGGGSTAIVAIAFDDFVDIVSRWRRVEVVDKACAAPKATMQQLSRVVEQYGNQAPAKHRTKKQKALDAVSSSIADSVCGFVAIGNHAVIDKR